MSCNARFIHFYILYFRIVSIIGYSHDACQVCNMLSHAITNSQSFFIPLYPLRVIWSLEGSWREAGAYPSCLLAQGRIHTFTHVHNYGQVRAASRPNPHVFGQREETRVSGENPHRQQSRDLLAMRRQCCTTGLPMWKTYQHVKWVCFFYNDDSIRVHSALSALIFWTMFLIFYILGLIYWTVPLTWCVWIFVTYHWHKSY